MKQFWIGVTATLLVLAACKGGNKPAASAGETADNGPTAAVAETDSTIYGTSDEFGMSTFTLVADAGDTLYLTRTAEDGTDGKIIGDLKEGERYAVTTRDNHEAIGVLINLTQLEKHTKDYKVWNGHLILNGDTVEIEKLTDKELKTK